MQSATTVVLPTQTNIVYKKQNPSANFLNILMMDTWVRGSSPNSCSKPAYLGQVVSQTTLTYCWPRQKLTRSGEAEQTHDIT